MRMASSHNLALLRMPVLGIPSHGRVRSVAEVDKRCLIEYGVRDLRAVFPEVPLPEGGTIGSLFLPRCGLTCDCIMKSWHLRMLKLSPVLYATMASASLARSVPVVLNARTTSSRPKRSKNAWTQTRLPMGTDKLSLRLIWNVLKCVCLVTSNHHSMISFHCFVPICHHSQTLLVLSKSGCTIIV